MQQSQRAHFNHALEHAIRTANRHGEPVLVGFGLTDDYPEANARHYAFLLEGLREVEEGLATRGIELVVRRGSPDDVALSLAQDASLVICDRGYLRHQKQWRKRVAREAGRRVVEVEGDVVVPVETASDKAESAARTLRPKIRRVRDAFTRDLSASEPKRKSLKLGVRSDLDLSKVDEVLSKLSIDRSVAPVRSFRGGTSEARRRLAAFLRGPFTGYGARRADPAEDTVSRMSPYLHFGQISAVEITRKVLRSKSGSNEDREAFLEELIVRRELAANFVEHTPNYDSFTCLPQWAQTTLEKHRKDDREHHYTRAQLEAADTHDPYWNAAMREMVFTGYMHNYMRMYWGKKILEWTNTPEHAYRTALALNNRYFLDGRDPSSYANVAWCFGLHDRAWTERPIFGKVRFMNARGLERKFDIEGYVQQVERLVEEETERSG
jgi:deoxyribodipyrimidine photo-lyase